MEIQFKQRGGQYERLIGIVKQLLYKLTGKTLLKLKKLKEVLMDIGTVLNNRPLSYVEDDTEMPELTPNLMIFGKKMHCWRKRYTRLVKRSLERG